LERAGEAVWRIRRATKTIFDGITTRLAAGKSSIDIASSEHTMRNASSDSSCSRDQEQPCSDGDGSNASRDALAGRAPDDRHRRAGGEEQRRDAEEGSPGRSLGGPAS
jgi:hypothetical protein